MFPWGHAAVAYLLYAAYRRRQERPMTATAAIAVVVASQLPDLIDKPLAWHLAVLPGGRTLAHSLLTGSVVLGISTAALVALNRTTLVAPVAIGMGSHAFADALGTILSGELQYLAFLLWPVLSMPPFDGPQNVVGIFAKADPLAPFFLFQLGLVAVALIVWHRDGRPGLDWLRGKMRNSRTPGTGPSD